MKGFQDEWKEIAVRFNISFNIPHYDLGFAYSMDNKMYKMFANI